MNIVSPKNTVGPDSPATVSATKSKSPSVVTIVPIRIIRFMPTRIEKRPARKFPAA